MPFELKDLIGENFLEVGRCGLSFWRYGMPGRNFEKKRGHASERERERRKNGDKNRLKRLGSDSS